MSAEDLIPFDQRSEDEVKKMGQKGGVNSGVARRAKRDRLQALKDYIDEGVGNDLTRYDIILRKVVTALKDKPTVADFQRLLELTGDFVQHQKVDINAEVSVSLSYEDAMRQLYMPFGENYQRFFYANRNERHVVLQGGRRSGKTQATIRHIARLGELMNSDIKVIVATNSFPMLTATMGDFTMIFPKAEIHNQQATTAGVRWFFKSYDEYTKAQGSECDILFINEAVNMDDQTANVLQLGTRLQCFYNFNPTNTSWVSSLVNDSGNNFLKTTFKDNPYLKASQVEDFEKMKERALSPSATLRDRYMYQVYYLGDFAKMCGQVFSNMERCSLADYQQCQATECYGIDFGFATNGDPTVLVGVKIKGADVYINQYIYQQGLTSDAELISRMLELGITEQTAVSCDYGGNGKQRIYHCRSGAGVTRAMNFINAIKPKIVDNLGKMLTYEHIYITDTSLQTLTEFEGYELDDNSKPKGADHAIDAVRYAFNFAERL